MSEQGRRVARGKALTSPVDSQQSNTYIFQITRVSPKRVARVSAVPVSRRTAAPELARGWTLTRSPANDVSEP